MSESGGGSFEWPVETAIRLEQRVSLPPREDGTRVYDSKTLFDVLVKEIELSLRFGSAVDDDDFDPPEKIKLEIHGYHLKNPETDEAYHVDVQAFLSREAAQNLLLALNTILNWKGL